MIGKRDFLWKRRNLRTIFLNQRGILLYKIVRKYSLLFITTPIHVIFQDFFLSNPTQVLR